MKLHTILPEVALTVFSLQIARLSNAVRSASKPLSPGSLVLFSLAALLLILASLSDPVQAQDTTWRAGTATVDITPEEPMPMAGYAFRENAPFEEIAERLNAKALVLEDVHGTRFVMVTADIIRIERDLREQVERHVYEQHGLPPAYLLLNASHTHSGPQVRTDPYRSQLREGIIRAIDRAMEDLEPVSLHRTEATAGFAINRRSDHSLPETDPWYRVRNTPAGPVDHQVPVLILRDSEDSIHSLVFGYACHNTTMGTQQISGDYAGFAQRILEETRPGMTALFMSGAGGDQNPHPRWEMVPGKEPLDLARLHGQTLALSVEAAINAQPREMSGSIRALYETVELPFDIPDRAELENRLDHDDPSVREWADGLLERKERGELQRSYDYPLQVVTFGPSLTLVAMGGEVVVDYSLRLKEEIDDPFLWVAAYSNDAATYIPSRRVLLEGEYEGIRARNRFGALFTPDVEERIVEAIHDMHGRLRAGGLDR